MSLLFFAHSFVCSSILLFALSFVCPPRLRQPPRLVGDLSEACGERPALTGAIAQGKIHCAIADGCNGDGKLYFATHVGYYTMVDGRETLPTASLPPGVAPYAGGQVLSFDPASRAFSRYGEFSFMYRYFLRESCSQFDSLP